MNRLSKAAVVFICAAGTVTPIALLNSGDSDLEYSPLETVINDVTQLNPIRVARALAPHSVEEVSDAIRSSVGPISIGGGRFSQGGQIAYEQSLHFVSCLTNSLHLRGRARVQCKARSAGNVLHLAKKRNAAVDAGTASRRALPTRPVASLRPLTMGLAIPCGTRLPTDRVGNAQMQGICETGH